MKYLYIIFWSIILLLGLSILLGCNASLTPLTPGATPGASASHVVPAAATPTQLVLPTLTLPVPTSLKSSPTELKYRLINRFGNVFYCDPDIYPIARMIDEKEFERRLAEIEKNTEEFQSILKHLGLTGATILSLDQKRLVYAEHKRLVSISLEPIAEQFRFSLRTIEDNTGGFAIQGQIDSNGFIQITQKVPTTTSCPICLTGNTLIDTPSGAVFVKDMRAGMPVWTADTSGERYWGVVLKTITRPIPQGIYLIRLVLDDGRMVFASPGHLTVDGRMIGDLMIGDVVDGGRVVKTERVLTNETATFDLLPSGSTGSYWANGIRLKSTLTP